MTIVYLGGPFLWIYSKGPCQNQTCSWYSVDIFHILILQEYWVLMESRKTLKPVLVGMRIFVLSISSVISVAITDIYLSKRGLSDLGHTWAHVSSVYKHSCCKYLIINQIVSDCKINNKWGPLLHLVVFWRRTLKTGEWTIFVGVIASVCQCLSIEHFEYFWSSDNFGYCSSFLHSSYFR